MSKPNITVLKRLDSNNRKTTAYTYFIIILLLMRNTRCCRLIWKHKLSLIKKHFSQPNVFIYKITSSNTSLRNALLWCKTQCCYRLSMITWLKPFKQTEHLTNPSLPVARYSSCKHALQNSRKTTQHKPLPKNTNKLILFFIVVTEILDTDNCLRLKDPYFDGWIFLHQQVEWKKQRTCSGGLSDSTGLNLSL